LLNRLPTISDIYQDVNVDVLVIYPEECFAANAFA